MRYISPEALIFDWPTVKPGLEKVKEYTSEDWLVEDVYMSLKTNNSALYVEEDEHGDYLGFFIAQILPTYHGKRLHVWCAYAVDGKPMMRVFLRDLKDLAAQTGVKKITFTSPRDEWLIVAKRGGFKPAQITYELPV
jgi:hypothetical protein